MNRQRVFAATLVVAACVISICGSASRAATDTQQAAGQATRAAESWLKLVDDGSYNESWDQASRYFKDRVAQESWAKQVGTVRQSLGPVLSRTLKRAQYATALPGAPDGQYVVIQYDTSFKAKKSAVETVTPMLDSDGKWRVSGYYIK